MLKVPFETEKDIKKNEIPPIHSFYSNELFYLLQTMLDKK
jgi:hypothetical protein